MGGDKDTKEMDERNNGDEVNKCFNVMARSEGERSMANK
jgi:hypothetical protein